MSRLFFGMCVCVCVCMYVCMYVYIYMRVYPKVSGLSYNEIYAYNIKQ
jgi:hypothetical protein